MCSFPSKHAFTFYLIVYMNFNLLWLWYRDNNANLALSRKGSEFWVTENTLAIFSTNGFNSGNLEFKICW